MGHAAPGSGGVLVRDGSRERKDKMQEEKYYLYDLYEGSRELIDAFDSIETATDAATDAAREHDIDTDGECDLILTTSPASQMALAEPGTILYDWRY